MKKPPEWQKFDRWVISGALVGLGIAFGAFCLVHFLLFGDFAIITNMKNLAGATAIKPTDVLAMTTTILGGLTTGGAAVIQYRKHKFEEYKTNADEDAKTGERLNKAIEHLGDTKHKHVRIGAIHELERLVEDSERDRERVIKMLTRFIQSRTQNVRDLTQNNITDIDDDIKTAADVLSVIMRESIETASKKAVKQNRFRPLKNNRGYRPYFLVKRPMLPSLCVFSAAEALSDLAAKNLFRWDLAFLKADWLDLGGIALKNAHLSGGSFVSSDLSSAHLEGAHLFFVSLENTNFSCAYLNGIWLFSSCIRDVDLSGTNLY